MATTTVEKIVVFDGKNWVIFSMKFAASLTKQKLGWSLLLADANKAQDKKLGDLMRKTYLAQFPDEEKAAKEIEAQTDVHSRLVMACIDVLPSIVASVPSTNKDCGTELWNLLLKKFVPTIGASKVRLTLGIIDQCSKFKSMLDSGSDTEDYFSSIETALRALLATGDPPTLEDIISILVIQAISKGGVMWETTAGTLSDLPADGERYEKIKERVRERFITFNNTPETSAKGPVAHAASHYPPVPGLSVVQAGSETLFRIDGTGQHFQDYFQAQAVLFQGAPPTGTANPATGSESTGSGKPKKEKKKCIHHPKLSNHWTSECIKVTGKGPVCKRCLEPGHSSVTCKAAEPHPSVLENKTPSP
mmetsp:Transcript_56121/g.114749  ORF Transcript_56121/g.114749 Transcript_56121/m.114749 type:complete len:362 (+) Transcript_56121:855-1940(+)